MGWINLIFWGVGLGMGGLLSELLRRSKAVPVQTAIVGAEPSALEQQSLLEQLQRTQLAYQMAAEMSQFKASFLARAAHELRSPLNGVISLHQLILSDLCDDPAEEREFVAQAHTAALKMLTRLDEVINVSKLEHGTSQLQIQPLQLIEVLEEVRRLTYLQAQNRSLRLEMEMPDAEVYVLADPHWFRQVLVNLITTSIAQMQEGYIRLSTQVLPSAEQVQIFLEDQRLATAGTSELSVTAAKTSAQVEPIADAFSQAGERSPAPGLNLIVSQTLMQMMQGRLEVLAVPDPDPATDTSKTSATATLAPQSSLTKICCSIPLATPDLD
jgi:signal transduction histidine kinase